MNQKQMLIDIDSELKSVVYFLNGKQKKVDCEELEQQVVLAALEYLRNLSDPPPENWKIDCIKHVKQSMSRYVYANGGNGGKRSSTISLDKENTNGCSLIKVIEDTRDSIEDIPTSPSDFLSWAARLRAAAYNSINEKDIMEIMEVVTKRAKKGNLEAVRLLFDYLMGGKISAQVHIVKRKDE